MKPTGSADVIASFPMYDWPEVRQANDSLWSSLREALRRRGMEAPETLERNRPREQHWSDPDLLISQTCGYPFAMSLRGTVRLIVAPSYVAEGCAGPAYSSAIIVRADAPVRNLRGLNGTRAAFNARDSQSGYNAFRSAIAPLAGGRPFFAETIETGAHLASLTAVADGRADCAAIDCVCWALAEHYRTDLTARLRVLSWSPLAPTLPFITAGGRSDADVQAIRDALLEVFADPQTAAVRRMLLVRDVEEVDEAAYEVIAAMEREAVAAGYPELA